MTYSDNVYKRAGNELRRRKQDAENDQKFRCADIYSAHPDVEEVCKKLEGTSREYLAIVLKGGSELNQSIEELKQRTSELGKRKRALLKEYTGDEEYLKIRYTCPVCEDQGYSDGRRCRCMDSLLKQYYAEEIAENCGIRLCDFSDFDPDLYPEDDGNGISPREKMKKLFNYCRRYSEGFGQNSPSLLFIGKTGLGKTFLSSCIAKELIQKGSSVVIGQLATFIRHIEDEHFGRSVGNTLDTLTACDLLILDDLGSEFRTSFTESALYEIVNARINTGKPMIISTNFSISELNSSYNERLISRITGCFVPCMFFGKDIRPAIRKF